MASPCLTNSLGVVVCGSGTVGYWATKALLRSPLLADRLHSMHLVDCACIKEASAITCPGYRGHLGEPKPMVLARLGAHWLAGTAGNVPQVVPQSVLGRVADIDWDGLLPRSVGAVVVVAGLDDWTARFTLAGDLQLWAALSGVPTFLLVGGVDKALGSIGVYDCGDPSAPCPACGYAALPSSEPCVVANRTSSSMRGNLQREAQEVAAIITTQVEAIADGDLPTGTGSRTVLSLTESGVVRRHTRSVQRDRSCWGPHRDIGPVPGSSTAEGE